MTHIGGDIRCLDQKKTDFFIRAFKDQIAAFFSHKGQVKTSFFQQFDRILLNPPLGQCNRYLLAHEAPPFLSES